MTAVASAKSAAQKAIGRGRAIARMGRSSRRRPRSSTLPRRQGELAAGADTARV
jgi:hypothetical protein